MIERRTLNSSLGNRFYLFTTKLEKAGRYWSGALGAESQIWFLGDSNLNRIPQHYNKNIQIDSYPGGSFYHFQQVLEKTPTHPQTKLFGRASDAGKRSFPVPVTRSATDGVSGSGVPADLFFHHFKPLYIIPTKRGSDTSAGEGINFHSNSYIF